MSARAIDLRGQKFGDLTALAEFGRGSNGGVLWNCHCSCGASVRVAAGDLKKWRPGIIRSCGCRSSEGGKKNTTHGQSRSPEFAVWCNLLDRCHNTRARAYGNYGGRGIYVCEEWRRSFDIFIKDMGPRPSSLHEIDRKDNDGPYSPENCRWATVREQARNRRSTVNLSWDGRTQCVTAWAEELGITCSSLCTRIKRWGLDRALATKGRTDGVRV